MIIHLGAQYIIVTPVKILYFLHFVLNATKGYFCDIQNISLLHLKRNGGCIKMTTEASLFYYFTFYEYI